jgi:hypothetical protein
MISVCNTSRDPCGGGPEVELGFVRGWEGIKLTPLVPAMYAGYVTVFEGVSALE